MSFDNELPVGYKHVYWEWKSMQGEGVPGVMVSEHVAKKLMAKGQGEVRQLIAVDSTCMTDLTKSI